MRTMSGSPCLHYDCSNRNSFGYCKTTVCINEHYQREQWGLPSTTNKPESVVIKPQTNADRIRSMSDDELADYYFSEFFGLVPYCHEECPEHDDCQKCLLKWLKEGAECSQK